MEKLFKEIKKANKLINQIEETIEEMKVSPFYKIFGDEVIRKRDIRELRFELNNALTVKSSLLDSLQIEIVKEQMNISSKERGSLLADYEK